MPSQPFEACQVHERTSNHIPCFYARNENSSKLLLYFHGYADGLSLAESQVRHIAQYCNVSVLTMEYLGQGTYSGNAKATGDLTKNDAEYVCKFCI